MALGPMPGLRRRRGDAPGVRRVRVERRGRLLASSPLSLTRRACSAHTRAHNHSPTCGIAPPPRPPQIDLPYAVSEDHLRQSLGLAGYTTGKGKPSLDPNIRPIEVYMCSVAKRMGYGEGFRWLSQYIK